MDFLKTIETYCAAWNEPDPVLRLSILQSVMEDDAVYSDPTVRVEGLSALNDHISTVQAKMPDSRLELISGLDLHHGFARFAWRMVLADGSVLPESIDVVEFSPSGKLVHVLGFFGPLK